MPKQLSAHGLKRAQLQLSDRVLRTIVREYTREAGVRNLERRLADVCRKAASLVAQGEERRSGSTTPGCASGSARAGSRARSASDVAHPGVATGLAYTTTGGDVLFVEATAYPGRGRLTITGQLGEVMQESAQAALSWVRSNAGLLGLPDDWFATHDVHVHVPAGAVPKDGPSAGVTMATAIVSLIRGEAVAADVGMTGEITLTGAVLPIGGLREKSLAAQRAGLKRIIFPRENEPDLTELPPEARDALEFVPVDTIEQVFDAAFSNGGRARARNVRPLERQAAKPAR